MPDAPASPTAETRLERRTRGRTRRGRLRALDDYLAQAERTLLLRDVEAGPCVDIGFGDEPWTTLEMSCALHSVNPALEVVGVELDPGRVVRAQAHATGATSFHQGGFELPLAPRQDVRLVRAMNVLRQYPLESVGQIHRQIGRRLVDGGLLMEGSSDTAGAVLVAHLLRKAGNTVLREALLFHTDFSRGFSPPLFRDWLPRDLRRRVKPGEPIHAFFEAWRSAWQLVRDRKTLVQVTFAASVRQLSMSEPGVAQEPWLLENGYCLWQPPGGVPA